MPSGRLPRIRIALDDEILDITASLGAGSGLATRFNHGPLLRVDPVGCVGVARGGVAVVREGLVPDRYMFMANQMEGGACLGDGVMLILPPPPYLVPTKSTDLAYCRYQDYRMTLDDDGVKDDRCQL